MALHPTGPRGRDGILAAIEAALRGRGYDGASIADLSEATGLGKSSLYHHFPGGKPQMVAACAEAAQARLAARVAAVTCVSCPREKLVALFGAFAGYFEGGTRMCLMTLMATSSAAETLRPILANNIEATISTIAGIVTEGGIAPTLARQRAEEAFAQVQGAVLIGQVTGDTALFQRLVASLPVTLLLPG
jgi:TetR/AcrR family transcriptional repressor of lmrAB and yxaGH operons